MHEGRLADRAYAGIIEIINTEDLEIGNRLPSEARLAEIFGISRTMVREALVRLASDGITEARRGAGSFVKRRPSMRLGSHMQMMDLSATMGSYEVRFVLEAEAARLAAMRRSVEQMGAIQRAMDNLSKALVSTGPAHSEDMLLHRAAHRGQRVLVVLRPPAEGPAAAAGRPGPETDPRDREPARSERTRGQR